MDALALFLRHRPDVVVADLWMPHVDGFELVRRVRALPPAEGGLTPAIALTASNTPDRETLMHGFQVHLTKPLDPARLVDALRGFADEKEGDVEPPSAAWTVISPKDRLVVLTLTGYIRTAALRVTCSALVAHLERQPCTVVVDLSRATGFDVAAPTAAVRRVWDVRHRFERIVYVGGLRALRLGSAAACALLGIRCDFVDEMPSGLRNADGAASQP
jgi:DNA-binding response OmpR family regulator